jgi:hypothetical protein
MSNPVMFILSDFSVQLKNCFTYLLWWKETHISLISWCTFHILKNQENFEILEYIFTVPLIIIATGNCPTLRLQLWNWYIFTTWRSKIQVFQDMTSCVHVYMYQSLMSWRGHSFHFQVRPNLFSPSWLTSGDDLKVYSQLRKPFETLVISVIGLLTYLLTKIERKCR